MKQILFIGLSSVGDVIMTTPVLESLHKKYPAALFDIVTDKRSIALYDNCPYKRNLYLKDKNKWLRGVPDLVIQLWKKQYDLIVDLRTDGLAYILRGKKRYTKWTSKSYGPHAVEELLGVIHSIHGAQGIPHPKVWLSAADTEYAEKQVSAFNNKDKLLALSVGDPNKAFKTWAVDKFIELLKKHKDSFSGFVFLGGESEHRNTSLVIEALDCPSINVTGNTLLQAAALLERSFLYIGPDSGLGHVASAVQTPTISFFSLMRPERFRPWGDKSICIQGADNDARNISVEDVNNAVRRFVNE